MNGHRYIGPRKQRLMNQFFAHVALIERSGLNVYQVLKFLDRMPHDISKVPTKKISGHIGTLKEFLVTTVATQA